MGRDSADASDFVRGDGDAETGAADEEGAVSLCDNSLVTGINRSERGREAAYLARFNLLRCIDCCVRV